MVHMGLLVYAVGLSCFSMAYRGVSNHDGPVVCWKSRVPAKIQSFMFRGSTIYAFPATPLPAVPGLIATGQSVAIRVGVGRPLARLLWDTRSRSF